MQITIDLTPFLLLAELYFYGWNELIFTLYELFDSGG